MGLLKYYTDLSYVRAKHCTVAWNSIFIRANGDVMFCNYECMVDFRLGNVMEHTISEL